MNSFYCLSSFFLNFSITCSISVDYSCNLILFTQYKVQRPISTAFNAQSSGGEAVQPRSGDAAFAGYVLHWRWFLTETKHPPMALNFDSQSLHELRVDFKSGRQWTGVNTHCDLENKIAEFWSRVRLLIVTTLSQARELHRRWITYFLKASNKRQ